MSLKTFVKINRVTNLTDARFCAGMSVDVIGFCLEKDSPHFISPTQFMEITGWISGIEYAAEFKHASSNEIKEILENYRDITWVESENLEVLIELLETGLNLIYKHPIEKGFESEKSLESKMKNQSIYLHLTSMKNGEIEEKQELVDVFSNHFKVILGFGVIPERVAHLLSTFSISGFALDSGDEIKPGLRNFDHLAAILELLETED